jgi:hypothetical protein
VGPHGNDLKRNSSTHLTKARTAFRRSKGRDPFTQAFDSVLHGALKGSGKALASIAKHFSETVPDHVKATSKVLKGKDHDVKDAVNKVETKKQDGDDTPMYLLDADGTVQRLMPDGTTRKLDPHDSSAPLAAVILEQVAERMGRVLEPAHPHALTTRQYLALNQGLAGDTAGATVTFQHLLTDLERLRDPEYPLLLTVQRQLADCRGEAGDAAGAVDAFRKLLQTTKRLLDPAHPDIVLLRYHLAHWRGMAGDAAGAADAYKELLADLLRTLDPDHPHVLETRTQIAIWQDQAGDSAGAVTALREAFRDKVQLFGPEHPETLDTRRAGYGGRRGRSCGRPRGSPCDSHAPVRP